ncbi:hypothetical protein [Nocardiopsis sp. NRRL B-16309]|uniref:hypothetical protein n=1 Tax=Nocardiopsis sp. NRRL B-16309 TaxID=1519494 RepID=UPI0006AE56B2|nr:hypothetical protein [Nocardiopsis sp. NRRL B-16309]KOX10182.1 hypothetical protein ADL05_26275 [Nocardiopsis sp. NRRL B-16309]
MNFTDDSTAMLYPIPSPPASTITRQQRWVIPGFGARGVTMWTLQNVLNEASAAYERSQEQTGAPAAADAITARVEGDSLVVSFESRSGVSAS